ncbi:hypothetical protein [Massilia sp. SYSU DXS3249]
MMHNGWTKGLVLVLAMLAAQGVQAQEEQRPLTPAEAAEKASRVNSRGFKGTFTFEVKGVGSNGEDSFILSEPDYRDPRCLTLRVTPQVREQLEARFGGKLDQVLAGRQIVVSGAAVRVRMEQVAQKVTGSLGEPSRGQEQTTGQFYFQTHIKVTQADQIALI